MTKNLLDEPGLQEVKRDKIMLAKHTPSDRGLFTPSNFYPWLTCNESTRDLRPTWRIKRVGLMRRRTGSQFAKIKELPVWRWKPENGSVDHSFLHSSSCPCRQSASLVAASSDDACGRPRCPIGRSEPSSNLSNATPHVGATRSHATGNPCRAETEGFSLSPGHVSPTVAQT